MLMYAVGAYVAKYDPLKRRSVLFCLSGFAICTAITIGIRIVIELINRNPAIEPKNFEVLVSYISPTVTLAAVFIVCGFAKIKIKRAPVKRVISLLCPLTFGVYLIHCHPVVAKRLQDAFVWVGEKPAPLALLITIGISLAIFSACMLIDGLRLLIFKLLKIKELSAFLERLIKKPIYFLLRIKDDEAEK